MGKNSAANQAYDEAHDRVVDNAHEEKERFGRRVPPWALAHLGITPLDRFFKAGGELVYTVPARVDGDATVAQIRLPLGVTADMVAAKRATLAANLGRASLETWATKGDEDRVTGGRVRQELTPPGLVAPTATNAPPGLFFPY